jgi:hypothetical protein
VIVESPKSRLLRGTLMLISSGFYDLFTGASLVQTAKESTITTFNIDTVNGRPETAAFVADLGRSLAHPSSVLASCVPMPTARAGLLPPMLCVGGTVPGAWGPLTHIHSCCNRRRAPYSPSLSRRR